MLVRLLAVAAFLHELHSCCAQQFFSVLASYPGYRFNGSARNPTITLTKGMTYVFNVTALTHPFRIIGDTSAASLQPSYNSAPECNGCVSADDVRAGPVVFTVPTGSTSPRIGYVCTLHSVMLGNFTLVDPSPTPSLTATSSPTLTPSSTPSASVTQTATVTASPSVSRTPSESASVSQLPTVSASGTSSQSSSQAYSLSRSGSGTGSQTQSRSQTRSQALTPTQTQSQAATFISSSKCSVLPISGSIENTYVVVTTSDTYFLVTSAFPTLGYRFNGGPINPTLSLYKGRVYTFNVTTRQHPFRIIANVSAPFIQPSYNTLPECGSCVNVSTGGVDTNGGIVTFTVPTGPLSPGVGYVCTAHSSMVNRFVFFDPTPTMTATPSQSATASESGSRTASVTGTSTATQSASQARSPTVTPTQVASLIPSDRFNGGAINPTLILIKGGTYTFNVTTRQHPFRIIANVSAPFIQPSYNTLPECGSCVNVSTGGVDTNGGIVTFTVPTGPLSPGVGYVCTAHSSMVNRFTFVEPTPSTTVTPSQSPSQAATPSQQLSAFASATQAATSSRSPAASVSASPSSSLSTSNSASLSAPPSQSQRTSPNSYSANTSSTSSGRLAARLSSSLTLHWDSAPLRAGTATVLNLTLEVSLAEIGGEGWIGLGFGESMVTAELSVTMLPDGARAKTDDMFAYDGYASPSSTGSNSRYTVVADTLSPEMNKRWVTFTRPLATFSGGLTYFTKGPISLVHAWHSGLELAYHGARQRVTGRLDFAPAPGIAGSASSVAVFVELDSNKYLKDKLRATHGFHAAAMSVAFLFFVPIGILVARYCRHQPNISFLHGSLMSLTAELVLAAATAAFFTHSVAHEMDIHRTIGVTTACAIITTIILAIAFTNMRRFGGANVSWWMRVRTVHEYFGWSVMALGWANVGLGLKFLWPEYLPIFYAIVVVVGTTIVGLDVRARALNGDCCICLRKAKEDFEMEPHPLARRHSSRRNSTSRRASLTRVAPLSLEPSSPSEADAVNTAASANDVAISPVSRKSSRRRFSLSNLASAALGSGRESDALPVWTAESVASRNAAHRTICYVIVDSHVVDLTEYKDKHPGGGSLLQDHAGKDISHLFSRDAVNADNEDIIHFHSRQAIALMKKMRVAVLAKRDGATAVPLETGATHVTEVPDGMASGVFRIPDASTAPPVAITLPPVNVPTKRIELRCLDVVEEDADGTVKTFIFEGPPGGLRYEPGQHGLFMLPAAPEADAEPAVDAPGAIGAAITSSRGVTRSWTLSLHPSAAQGRVVISVKRGANASRRLHESMTPQGGHIRWLGVAGSFTPALSSQEGRPVILLAGGIGITPMRAMLPSFIAEKRAFALVYSVRTISEAPFVTELLAVTRPSGYSVTVTATREPQGSTWTGRRGRIDAALIEACAPGGGGVRACDVFICGPRPFEGECREILKASGLRSHHIFSESFEAAPQ